MNAVINVVITVYDVKSSIVTVIMKICRTNVTVHHMSQNPSFDLTKLDQTKEPLCICVHCVFITL